MPTTIVHIINKLHRGGAEVMLVRLLQATAACPDERHVVVTLLPGGELRSSLETVDVEVHELGFGRGLPAPLAAWRGLCLLRRINADVLVAWLYQSAAFATLAIPFIGRPRLIWNLRGTGKDPARSTMNGRLTVRLLRWLSRWPWAVAVNSRAGRIEHERLRFRPRRWAYLPNGFEEPRMPARRPARPEIRARFGLENDATVVVCVARADPQKDHATLLLAAERFLLEEPKTRLLLVGRGTDALAIPSSVRTLVTALGERDDVAELLTACDIAVLSSAFGEGLPNAVAEAMLSGLPCVVTDVGDAADLVGPTGLVVPPGTVDDLAEAVLEMVSFGNDERARLGEAARQRVIDRYSMERSVRAYQRLWSNRGLG